MKISELKNAPKWLLDAETVDADVEWSTTGVLWWNSGEFLGGAFLGGEFRGGAFLGGEFLGGEFWGGAFLGGEFLGGEFWGDKLSQNPLSIYGLRWPVVISAVKMQVGCERHTFAEWEALNDATINKMDRGALKFWREHKATLLSLCAAQKVAA